MRLLHFRPFLFAVPLLAGCTSGQVARNLGFVRDSPDEFTVTTRAPLSMPSDFSLPPPDPGAARPQEPATRLAAEATLTPSVELDNRTGIQTPGQQALVAAAGPAAPADIRLKVDAEAQRVNSNTGVVNTLKFWRTTPPPGKVIDPVKEAARLRATNAAATVVSP